MAAFKKKYFYIIIFIMIFSTLETSPSAMEISRRRDQFLEELSYMLYPLPYSLPGIGTGLMIIGHSSNMFGTYADADGMLILGDAAGSMFRLNDIHLLPKHLILDIEKIDINKAVVNNYKKRGMDTDKDEYNLLKISKYTNSSAKLTLTFFERMLEIETGIALTESVVDAIKDSNGDTITELGDPIISKAQSYHVGINLDYTDDYTDPRKGVRANAIYRNSPRQNSDGPSYFIMDYSLSCYLPVGKLSSLVLNLFHSDAYVTSEGETNSGKIKNDLGFNCGPSDTECLNAEQSQINNRADVNRHGNATSMGGADRLRSYPMSRFQGGHSEFLGLEFRWNLTDEFSPFDYFIWKDVRTGVQLAFYGEVGTVSEYSSDLWKRSRSSFGMGIRMITGSGIVYRGDLSYGDEGLAPTVMFNYPW